MSGHLDLRNDRDMARRGVGDQVTDLRLGVEATVGATVSDVGVEILREHGFLAPCANLGEQRVLLDFQTPTLVIGQVQLQSVQFVEREKIDELLDELGRVKPARHVQQNSPIGKPRLILDLQCRDGPTC